MIFVTVGTQLPFRRLIDAMDRIAGDLDEPAIAQVGPETGDWPNLTHSANLAPDRFEETFEEARLVVAHAGIGTILSAKRFGKPLVVLPRRYALGEHRNDHQLATARAVQDLTGVHVAWEVEDLPTLVGRTDLTPANGEASAAHAALIDRLRDFIGDA